MALAWQGTYGDAPPQLLAHVREAQLFAGAPFEVPLPGERWIRVIEHAREDGRTSAHFDITTLKREQATLRAAEAEARRSASHLRGIIERMPAGMLVVDAAGTLIEATAPSGRPSAARPPISSAGRSPSSAWPRKPGSSTGS